MRSGMFGGEGSASFCGEKKNRQIRFTFSHSGFVSSFSNNSPAPNQ